MAYRLALALALMVVSDIPLLAQFGSPYPGVGGGGLGMPGGGISLPGTGRRGNQQQNGPVDSLTGKIHRISTSQLILDMDDGREVTVALDRNTRYFDTSGSNAKYGDFDNGDQITADAALDNQSFYHGRRITMVKKYLPSDQSNNTSSSQGSSSDGSASSSSSDDNDPGRPRLKRAGSASSDSSSGNNSASGNSGSSSGDDNDPGRPRLKRAGSASSDSSSGNNSASGNSASNSTDSGTIASNRPSTTTAPRAVAPESDDPGPPVLRRNSPARVDNTPPAGTDASEIATARPSIKAGDANGITQRPAPPAVSTGGSGGGSSSEGYSNGRPPVERPGDAVINQARDAAFEFTDSLPNYIVKQYTTRYQTDSAHGNRTSWQPLDIVTADVVCEAGKESYKNILINGRPPRDSVEKSGSWSTGEFATVLQGILAPQTDADFHNKRSTTIVNRAAYRYDYSVEQPRSMWHVYASSESYVPAYTGSIWIDKENFRVLRIEMSAVNMPRSFALDAVESAVDYDYVLIGDKKVLLPVHSEALSCVRGTADCTRNVIEFRNYKKFTADSSITFDDK